MDDLIRNTACEVVGMLKSGAVSPLECLEALEARIAAVDPAVNALPTLCFERARQRARGKISGPLHGLPIPIKDLADVAGVRSTQGSPIFADNIPDESDLVVEHLERNGAIVYAMSNTPEFGAGAHTF